MEIGFESQ